MCGGVAEAEADSGLSVHQCLTETAISWCICICQKVSGSSLISSWAGYQALGSHDLSSRPQPKRVLGACACCAEQTSMWVPT